MMPGFTDRAVTREPALLTGPEVARLFRVDPRIVQNWARSGRIGSIQTPGGRRRYPAAQFAYVINYLRGKPIPYGEGISS